MEREVQAARAQPEAFGRATIALVQNAKFKQAAEAAAEKIVVAGRLTSMSLLLLGESGAGKTYAAAAVYMALRSSAKWLTAVSAPWAAATQAAEFVSSVWCIDALTGVTVRDLYAKEARLLVLDGLGEESIKYRAALEQVIKERLDAGRPTIMTSRLGSQELGAAFPTLSAMRTRNIIVAAAEAKHAR